MGYMPKLSNDGLSWVSNDWEMTADDGMGAVPQTVTGVVSGGAPITVYNLNRNIILTIKSAALLATKQIVLPANMAMGKTVTIISDKGVTALTYGGGFTIQNDSGMLTTNTPVTLERISATEWAVV